MMETEFRLWDVASIKHVALATQTVLTRQRGESHRLKEEGFKIDKYYFSNNASPDSEIICSNYIMLSSSYARCNSINC